MASDQQRLIARLFGGVVGLNGADVLGASTMPPGDHPDAKAMPGQVLHHSDGGRGFAGTAGHDIAHHDHESAGMP